MCRHKKHKEDIEEHKHELRRQLEEAHATTVTHRSRVMSVDDGLGLEAIQEKIKKVRNNDSLLLLRYRLPHSHKGQG